jgi:hypothetical protein
VCKDGSFLPSVNEGRVHPGGSANRFGPAFASFHLILAKIKEALDPSNVANPIRVIDMEAMEKPRNEASFLIHTFFDPPKYRPSTASVYSRMLARVMSPPFG